MDNVRKRIEKFKRSVQKNFVKIGLATTVIGGTGAGVELYKNHLEKEEMRKKVEYATSDYSLLNECITVEKMNELISLGANANQNQLGLSALNYAANDVEKVKVLLKAGANPKGRTMPPLFSTNNLEVAKILLDAGADINALNNKTGRNLLSHTDISPELKKFYIDNGVDINFTDCEYGRNALCFSGSFEDSKILINAGIDLSVGPFTPGPDYYNQPKKKFFASKPIAFIMALRKEKNVDKDLIDDEINFLMDAYIAKGIDISPLLFEEDIDLVKLAISKNADPNIKNVYNLSHIPIDADSVFIKLAAAKNVNPDIENLYGITPLMQTKSVEKAQILIEAGANPNAKDKNGETALMKLYSVEMTEFLLAHKANINATDNNGQTALIKAGDREIYTYKYDYGDVYKIWECLIENKANLDIVDKYGQSALGQALGGYYSSDYGLLYGDHMAVSDHNVEMLLKHGANMNIIKQDIWNDTYLCGHGELENSWVKRKKIYKEYRNKNLLQQNYSKKSRM